MLLVAWAFAVGTSFLAGCSETDTPTDNTSGLPPDGGGSDGGASGDGGEYQGGQGGGGGPEAGDDETPANTLTLIQEGTWTLSPYPGPYESMNGQLVVTELLDGDATLPACSAVFALTGFVSDQPCDDCAVVFEVTHTLAQDGDVTKEGDEIPGLDACMAPDLPLDGEAWILGLSNDGATIYKRASLSGWVPWFEADQRLDDVEFSWTGTVGIELEDEDDQ